MRSSGPLLLIIGVLAGCTAGPNFERPAAPAAQAYNAAGEAPPAPPAPVNAQQIVLGAPVSSEWWTLFGSAPLNDVVTHALGANPTLVAARSTLEQAQELVTAAGGARYPRLDATAGAGRQKYGKQFLGALTPPPPFTYFAGGLAVNYTFDFSGGIARTVEERRALAEYQHQELRAAQLALSGDVVAQAVEIATASERLRTLNELLEQDRRNLTLVQQSFGAGNTTRVDVLFAQSQLANDETLLPPAQQDLEVARHALAVLVGHAPSDWSAPDFDFSKLSLPARLPVSLPSELVRQRPDILASEAQLHAATAEVGVATANLYPHVTLTGALGEQALTLGTLFASGNGAYSLTSGLTQPLFDGGTLRATRRADLDAMNARLADYQHTVLQSLRQVADVLGSIDHDAQLLAAEARAVDAAQASLDLARQSYQAGNSGILQVLDAERAVQRSRLEYVRVAGQRLHDSARLFLALGGAAP
jgi:NodT family efflux transporter outer membrane factor (OMF) lipoprotein